MNYEAAIDVPKWEGSEELPMSLGEKLINILFIRGPIATGIGLTLEFAGWMLFGFLLGPTPLGEFVMNIESPWFHGATFVMFHIIGWMIMWEQWPVLSGEVDDSMNPSYGALQDNEFVVEQGSYVISGRVYRK